MPDSRPEQSTSASQSGTEQRRLGIGVVTSYLPHDRAGGAQIQAVRMAAELAASHDVILFARGSTKARQSLPPADYKLVLRQPVETRAMRLLDDVRIAVGQIRQHREHLDVLLCYQSLAAGLIGARARATLKIPCLVSIRGRHEYRMDRLSRFRLLVPYVYRTVDRVLVQAQPLAEEVLAAFDRPTLRGVRDRLKDRLRVLPNGVDQRARKLDEGAGLVFVGRLIEGKGVRELIEALRTLPGVELTVVGDGPQRAELERLATGLAIRFTGHLEHDQAVAHIASSQCLVLPSHSEAFPNVVLEAMSLGVPTVATRVGGTVELVQDGVTGLLVPPRDPRSLADALHRILDDEPFSARLSQQSLVAVGAYAWPTVVERAVAEFRAVLSELDPAHAPQPGESS
jgi:glycosyltransferase involved in cell wall biosynthesis